MEQSWESKKKRSKKRHGAGSIRKPNEKRRNYDVGFSLGSLGRRRFKLPTCKTMPEAEKRTSVLAELVRKLLAAELIDLGLPLLERAATCEVATLDGVVGAVELLVKGSTGKKVTGETTFRDVARQWLTGELTRRFKDHVKPRKDANAHLSQLESHILPVIGDIPMSRFTLAHAQEAMRRLPEHHAPGTRRCFALVIHRIVALGVFPLNLLPYNPLPKGFVPPAPPRKAMSHLYPSEEAQLLACRETPLCDRVIYAFLNREGMRSDEAFKTEWSDLDLEHGAVVLDTNKTNDPRAWALSPDVVRALKVWRILRRGEAQRELYGLVTKQNRKKIESSFVFYHRGDLAARLRDDLRMAGVKREVLFEHSATRQRMRAHDMRATFITIGLANGRTETWIMDRTGHRSSGMVNKYRRAARTASELGLGTLRPMDEAIPEIAEFLAAERAAQAAAPTNAAREHDAGGADASDEAGDADGKNLNRVDAVITVSRAARRRRAANAVKGDAPSPEAKQASPAARKARSKAAGHGGGPEAAGALPGATATATTDESRTQGSVDDVAGAPPDWSTVGPRGPEGLREVAGRSKNLGKDRVSGSPDTRMSISK